MVNDDSLIETLKFCGLPVFDVGHLGLISFFDDIHYINNDYDVLDGSSRSQVYHCLTSHGWTAKGSREFHKGDKSCLLPRPSGTLGTNPSDTIRESLSQHTYHIVTPTQALLTLLAEGKWDLKVAESLVFEQPANIDKFIQWANHDKLSKGLTLPVKRLKEVQKQGLLKRKGKSYTDPSDIKNECL
jgi:hypothetical protein